MSTMPYVTIGVPVYHGELFIQEALRSIQNQTHRNIETIISLDGPQPETERLCQPFLEDARFRLVVQPERLGWVGNMNWLMAQVETPYWYCHMHDDLVDPRYVEVLLKVAQQNPNAAVVYCDIAAFGLRSSKIVQSSITGGAFARQLTLLRKHHSAIAFRGLTRVEALRHSGGIPANEVENFSADTTWMAAIARWGELRRVPVAMYRKRLHTKSEHRKWYAWPVEKRTRAWVVHCTDMLEQAFLVDATARERWLLWLAAVERLVSLRLTRRYLPIARWTMAERLSMLEMFFEYLRTARRIDLPRLLEINWDSIQYQTREFYIHKAARLNFWDQWRSYTEEKWDYIFPR